MSEMNKEEGKCNNCLQTDKHVQNLERKIELAKELIKHMLTDTTWLSAEHIVEKAFDVADIYVGRIQSELDKLSNLE